METMRKVGRFFKRVAKGYFELCAQSYATRCTGNVWINPEAHKA